jgi:hypothetical protein
VDTQQAEIKRLKNENTILRETLEGIRDHEHVASGTKCELQYDHGGPYGPRPKNDSDDQAWYRVGLKQGHRCCSTIAAEGLKAAEKAREEK